ncbi:MAG: hypothetical protein ACK4WH_05030 [Phycisphaerales bacterium]
MTFVITIMSVLLVVGSLIAVWWWRISAKIAPYGDEAERARARAEEARREAEANTHVISGFGDRPSRRD